MADMFIKIDGIKGESTDDKHKDEIDVLSWSWGATQSGTMHGGPGGGSAKVTAQDVTFEKYVDKSTPAIIKHLCTGQHIKTVKLTVRKAGGDKPVDYMVMDMEDALFSSYHTGGSESSLEQVNESITMNAKRIKVTYTPQTDKGGAGGASTQGYDFGANKLWS